MYLCYDIRGIQSFIFQIPRLKYIIGGSARVDRFDRRIVPRLAAESGWDLICAGGGKGAFRAASQEQCDSIQASIIAAVREFGADVRFGRHEVYSEAAHCTDRLFPYLPDNLKGHPCKESGLYPVEGGDVHEVVRARDWSCGEHIPRWFEEQLLESGEVELPLGLGVGPLGFMRDVDEGTPGFGVLGKRNRWAVICMDGNDMGSQFRWMTDTNRDEAAMIPWVKEVGKALDTSSRKACLAGMKRVLAAWVDDESVRRDLETGKYRDHEGRTVLPLRPLVVGGDDIAMLCHASHAATFVREACRAFEECSERLAQEAQGKGIELWPATGGRVTISAGVLYCGTSLPLATAIPYAENLQALAKAKGRRLKGGRTREPAPACIDFEAVTESMLDTPLTRRERELIFLDADLGSERVALTRRPYTIEDFGALLDEAKRLRIPGSILHQLLPGLRSGFHDRQVFRWRLGKRQDALFEALEETADGRRMGDGLAKSHWRRESTGVNQWCRHTDLIDMALLAQEDHRMAQETAQ